jgi:protein-S-isoprenylcysteine O-methyltransferase
VRTRFAAFGVLAVFLVAERALRRGEAARTIEPTADDRGTTRLIGTAYAFAFSTGLLSPLIARRTPARIGPTWLAACGLPIMLVGLALRVWAALTLGRFYTRTLRTATDQPVVRSGPYAVVRHPGYLGDLVMWLGFGLCSGAWVVAASIALVMAFAYARRIAAEDVMLQRSLGNDYVAYAQRTARLLPGLY